MGSKRITQGMLRRSWEEFLDRYAWGILREAEGHPERCEVRRLESFVKLVVATNAAVGIGVCRREVRDRLSLALDEINHELQQDAMAAMERDPVRPTFSEVVLAYPGFYAIMTYRLAHRLDRLGLRLVARFLSEVAHSRTGIDIHPGAKIDPGLFIDHGTGVVIGQTSVIGRDVTLFHGVTLGALTLEAGGQRHPTLEDGVTVYANATILGGETVVGAGARIGANALVRSSVPSGSRISTPRVSPSPHTSIPTVVRYATG